MMKYWIDGDYIRFEGDERGGLMHKDYSGPEMDAYLAWVAEGNTAPKWTFAEAPAEKK